MILRAGLALIVIVSLALCGSGSAQPRRTQISQPPSGCYENYAGNLSTHSDFYDRYLMEDGL